MITAIEIENFKGIGKRQRIEFAPITLLFGNNGSGKSTVAYALMLFDQVFRERDLSLDNLPMTGNAIRLGGENRPCHNHAAESIGIRIEFTPNKLEPPYSTSGTNWIEMTIRASVPPQRHLRDLHFYGPAFIESIGFGDGDGHKVMFTKVAGKTRIEIHFSEVQAKEMGLERTEWILEDDSGNSLFSCLGRIPTIAGNCHSKIESVALHFSHDLVTNIHNSVDGVLHTYRHIGPMRARPGVNFIALPPSHVEPSWWYDGSAAWHFFCHTHETNQIGINQWLGPEYLDTGIELRSKPLIDQSKLFDFLANAQIESNEDLSNIVLGEALRYSKSDFCQIEAKPLWGKDIASDDAPSLPICDLGFGVSQIVPIVVACIIRQGALISIEEPESHVHPRLQSSLGDLLIHSTSKKVDYGDPNQLLIETHSEHIILRLLRRIRESAEGESPKHLQNVFSSDIAVNYFDRVGNATKVIRLRINEEGEFIDSWPYGFFDERIGEMYG